MPASPTSGHEQVRHLGGQEAPIGENTVVASGVDNSENAFGVAVTDSREPYGAGIQQWF